MNLTKIFIPLVLSIYSTNCFSQKEGDAWVIGYYNRFDTMLSVIHLDFTSNDLEIEWHHNEKFWIIETCASICDSNGDALLWTNGMQIFGFDGDTIARQIAYVPDPDGYWNYFYTGNYALGFPAMDGALILPFPGKDDTYEVLYHFAEPHPTLGFVYTQYMEATVVLHPNATFNILKKDIRIEPYHNSYSGTIIANRHANGRDWWIITSESDSKNYYAYLLDPSGIHLDHKGTVSIAIPEGLGQATFSTGGNFMVRMDATTLTEGQFISLFSFDRCTGELILVDTINTAAGYFTGAAFSPSERYLYADDNFHLWQWDLLAEDLKTSKTLVDTFDGFVQPGWFGTGFGPIMQGPEGRIYIVPPSGSSEFIHVIDRPDLPATECKFRQHHIDLQKPNGRSAPNIPNYRLGPLDGSTCDTLGINNLPQSRWRYEPDEPENQFLIRFTDLSFFDPQTWHWDFDDGSTSDTPSPLHTFEPGLYHVCLTVSNPYATDSTCQWVEILPTDVADELDRSLPDLSIVPNPFQDFIQISSRSNEYRNANFRLYDFFGRLIFDQHKLIIPSKLFIPNLLPGIYLCMVQDEFGNHLSQNLVKE